MATKEVFVAELIANINAAGDRIELAAERLEEGLMMYLHRAKSSGRIFTGTVQTFLNADAAKALRNALNIAYPSTEQELKEHAVYRAMIEEMKGDHEAEIAALQQKHEQLMDGREERIQQMDSELERVRLENEGLITKLGAQHNIALKLHDQVNALKEAGYAQALREQLEVMRHTAHDYQRKNAVLEMKLKQGNDYANAIRKEIGLLREDNDRVEGLNHTLREQLNAARQTVRALQGTLANTNLDLDRREQQVISLTEQLNAARTTATANQLREEQEAHGKAQHRATELNLKLSTLLGEVAKLTDVNQRLRESNTTMLMKLSKATEDAAQFLTFRDELAGLLDKHTPVSEPTQALIDLLRKPAPTVDPAANKRVMGIAREQEKSRTSRDDIFN